LNGVGEPVTRRLADQHVDVIRHYHPRVWVIPALATMKERAFYD
jgi:hypothetical protein